MEPAWTEGRIGSEASSFIPSKEPVASLLGVTGVETTGTLMHSGDAQKGCLRKHVCIVSLSWMWGFLEQ